MLNADHDPCEGRAERVLVVLAAQRHACAAALPRHASGGGPCMSTYGRGYDQPCCPAQLVVLCSSAIVQKRCGVQRSVHKLKAHSGQGCAAESCMGRLQRRQLPDQQLGDSQAQGTTCRMESTSNAGGVGGGGLPPASLFTLTDTETHTPVHSST